ncbi:MAG: RnfABCDGE type electron transport complex subunit D [Firmicutes bacterium]|nr:RnfABCDGE type electron transport complex subunit D [Bacillota bacterium]
MAEKRLIVSSSPHLRSPIATPQIMRDVIIALIPASAMGILFFKLQALLVILVGVAFAIITEAVIQKALHKPVTINDYSAAVAGLLLALVLPPTVPLWIPAIGSIVAIGVAKHVFGGLGQNPFNPALIGRAVLLASWPVLMTRWVWPVSQAPWMQGFDALTTATPLALLKLSGIKTPYAALFFGNVAGSIGETSVPAILLGALYLIWRGHITFRIPGYFIGTVAVLSALFGQDPLFHILAGGLMIGAFFMATDYVSTPVTPRGQALFGIGCGVLTVMIRLFGGYPEGVCYAILIMDATTAVLDKFTRPRKFGEVRRGA